MILANMYLKPKEYSRKLLIFFLALDESMDRSDTSELVRTVDENFSVQV